MKKMRVVLVDDEIMIREGFKKLFNWEEHDCQVVGEASDGMEALTVIEELLPDIVIMDINIPIMNGLKVIQTCRLRYPDMAFIIVSGYDDFSYCREALRMQITDYILKPVNYEEFGSCIDRLKIALYEKKRAEVPEEQRNRTISEVLRYLQEHLEEEISLVVCLDTRYYYDADRYLRSRNRGVNGESEVRLLFHRLNLAKEELAVVVKENTDTLPGDSLHCLKNL